MTGMAVLPLFDQFSAIVTGLPRVTSAVTGGARMENISTERENIEISNAGFPLGHHLGSGRARQSDGSAAAVRHDDAAGDVSFGTPLHPKRANERQFPTNTVGRRARLDDGPGAFLPVAVACNERPVRVASRSLNRVPSVGFSLLLAAKHDEGVYRFHSLT